MRRKAKKLVTTDPQLEPGELIEPPPEKPKKVVTRDTPKSEGGPDHNIGTSYNADVYSIPQPWIFRYPNDQGDRRDVKVGVHTYRNFAFGASHFYAHVDVEENSIWDPKELTWKVGEHLAECKKTQYRAHVFTRKEAVEFIEMVVLKWFSDAKMYRVHTNYSEDDATWEDVKRELMRDVDDV